MAEVVAVKNGVALNSPAQVAGGKGYQEVLELEATAAIGCTV